MAEDLGRIAGEEANPALAGLVREARDRGIDRLLDDDALTLGHGAGSRTWATDALPDAPGWTDLHDIPLALVTGTNGKTTTTRLIAAMGQAAGRVAGLSSTDFVRVGDDIIDRGDYSGPAGARLLLRDPRLELGVLEVARGGILRRGLPVTRARAAVVTNVAADHLGQYGINTVPELAQVKLTVRRGLAPGGWLILNADDPEVRAAARGLPDAPVWFALDPARGEIRAARAAGLPCGWLEDGVIILSDGRAATPLIAADAWRRGALQHRERPRRGAGGAGAGGARRGDPAGAGDVPQRCPRQPRPGERIRGQRCAGLRRFRPQSPFHRRRHLGPGRTSGTAAVHPAQPCRRPFG
jgi:hypothetical protein